MKFGDKIKVSEKLWTELVETVPKPNHSKMKNCFLFIIGNSNKSIILSIDELTDILGATDSENCIGTSWEKYIFWRNYCDVRSAIKFVDYIDNHEINRTGKYQPVPGDYNKILQNKVMTFDSINTTELSIFEEISKSVLSGGKCLICKDFNPYMEKDGFCWSCNNDPRNKFKIENLMKTISV